MKQDQHVVVGRIGKSHGVQGWMRVQSFTEPPEQLLAYQPWYWSNDTAAISVEDKQHKGAHLMIKLAGCDDPETVREQYTNRNICVLRSQLPDTQAGEYYWNDLIGCEVNLHNGSTLGTIDHLFDTPGNDVMVITKPGEKKRLIPWTKDVVLAVDMNQRCITVDWTC